MKSIYLFEANYRYYFFRFEQFCEFSKLMKPAISLDSVSPRMKTYYFMILKWDQMQPMDAQEAV
jgi:hypothetical protein